MTAPTALDALADRVEAATGAEVERDELGVQVNEALGVASYITEAGDPCLSVDGAIAIVPDGYDYAISREGDAGFSAQVMPNGCDAFDWRAGISSRAKTMPTCLTAAALRARAAVRDESSITDAEVNAALRHGFGDRVADAVIAEDVAAKSEGAEEPPVWLPIASAPTDRTVVTVLVPMAQGGLIQGQAYYDDEAYGGSWWWDGTSNQDYFTDPISECNHGDPLFWLVDSEQEQVSSIAFMRENPVSTGASQAAVDAVVDRFVDWTPGPVMRGFAKACVQQALRRAGRASDAIAGIADDYMTSEAHHPGYVLIPVAKFEQLRDAATQETTDVQ